MSRAETGVRAAAEAQIFLERQNADLREMLAHERNAAVVGAVIDDQNFTSGNLFRPRQ